jgi:hypothetical protein
MVSSMESERTMSSSPPAAMNDSRQELAIEHIRHALNGLRFGSVVVTVQDGVVVQIDRTEKNRLAAGLNGRHAPQSRTAANEVA